MKSLWLLKELRLPFQLQTYGFGGDLRTNKYLGIHPLGRVPCLEIDGTILFESGAITEYLCETTEGHSLGHAPGHPARAAWLQWLHYSETITVHLANLTQQFIALREPAMRSVVVVKLETRRLQKAIAVVDEALRGRPHLLGDFSAVDIGVGYALHVARYFTDIDPGSEVGRYHARLADRPAFRAALPAPGDPLRFYRDAPYRLD